MKLGGHSEKKTGTYHLHRGPLSGRNFDSKSDAKVCPLNSLTKTLYPNMVTGNVWRGLTVCAMRNDVLRITAVLTGTDSSVEYAIVNRIGRIYSSLYRGSFQQR